MPFTEMGEVKRTREIRTGNRTVWIDFVESTKLSLFVLVYYFQLTAVFPRSFLIFWLKGVKDEINQPVEEQKLIGEWRTLIGLIWNEDKGLSFVS